MPRLPANVIPTMSGGPESCKKPLARVIGSLKKASMAGQLFTTNQAGADQETETITLTATQNLIAASKVGEGIEWTKEERITVSTASFLA